jgi:hypothetical protein
MRRLGRLRSGVSNSIIAQWRLARFEWSVHHHSDAVVVLSEGDLPADSRVRAHTTILEPVLDRSPDRWQYSGRQELFFVGNCAHYPNFLAVKWLAERFAPALARRCPGARIRIVGTAANQVPLEWHQGNIEYMGPCDEQTVTALFTTSDFFIGPIENNFGAKMKVMQCLTHGTPILATAGALSGVPFKDQIPRFSLEDPDGAAESASKLFLDKTRLIQLSSVLTSEHARLLSERDGMWIQLIEKIKAQPLRPISRPSILSPFRRRGTDHNPNLKRWPKRLEIGVEEPPGVVTSGMYSLERDQSPFRWTSGIAELEVPLNQKTLPTALTLRLLGICPPNGTNIRVLINGPEFYRGEVRGKEIDQTIQLPDLSNVSNLHIRLESSCFQPEGDVRKLGVAVRSIVLSR